MRARAIRAQAPPAARREPSAAASRAAASGAAASRPAGAPPVPAPTTVDLAGRRQQEANRLEVRRRLGVMTAGEGERLGTLRRQMEAHWASARERARRQPDVLRALRAAPEAGPEGGAATPLHGAPSALRLPASPPAHLLRAPGDGAAPGGRFLVEDSEVPGPGQVPRGDFLRYLRQQVSAMADEVLAALGQSADDCPYIRKWFAYYEGQDVAHVETSIRRYAPAAMAAGDWREAALRVVERARRAFEEHVDTGSLDGAPDDVEVEPAELVARPAIGARGQVQTTALQRCCGGEAENEGERGRLIGGSSSSSIFEVQPFEFNAGPDLPSPGDLADFSGWSPEPHLLKGRWDVYTKTDGKWILAIATTGTGRVVANSSLEHTGVKFTSFGSNPPFSGLGSVVLDKLVERVEASSRAELYPSGPVPGSVTFYTKMGMGGALKEQGLKIPKESTQKFIGQGIRERLDQIVEFDLEDREVRKRLQQIQKWVVATEQKHVY